MARREQSERIQNRRLTHSRSRSFTSPVSSITSNTSWQIAGLYSCVPPSEPPAPPRVPETCHGRRQGGGILRRVRACLDTSQQAQEVGCAFHSRQPLARMRRTLVPILPISPLASPSRRCSALGRLSTGLGAALIVRRPFGSPGKCRRSHAMRFRSPGTPTTGSAALLADWLVRLQPVTSAGWADVAVSNRAVRQVLTLPAVAHGVKLFLRDSRIRGCILHQPSCPWSPSMQSHATGLEPAPVSTLPSLAKPAAA